MSDINKKNINYGALNRFYQDLKSHDLSDLNDKIDNIDVPEYVAGEGIAIDSANTISCTVKPIADVNALPDADENKDSVLRLNGDEQVYISKYATIPITPTVNAPDEKQINRAFCFDLGDESAPTVFYRGAYTITCADGVLNWYLWSNDVFSNYVVAEDDAEHTTPSTIGYFREDLSNVTETGATTTLTKNEFKNLTSSLLGWYPQWAFLTNKAPDSIQIGNAYFENSISNIYYYTGEEITFVYNGETKTGYKWAENSASTIYYLTEDKAENIVYYNTGNDVVWLGKGYYYHTNGTITHYDNEYNFETINENAPDSEQIGNAYIEIDYSDKYIYTGEQANISGNSGYKWELSNHNDFIITVGVKAANLYTNRYKLQNGDVTILKNSTGTAIDNSHIGDFELVQYKRTTDVGWQWLRVVTEDEIVPEIGENESVFTGATLTVDGTQPSIVASGSTTIVWDDLASSIPSGKSVEVSVVLINTGNSALTPTMSGNYQMMGDGNLTIQPLELGLYKAKYISAVDVWLVEAIYQEVSGIME